MAVLRRSFFFMVGGRLEIFFGRAMEFCSGAIVLLTNDKVAVMVRVGGLEMGAKYRTLGRWPATMMGRDIRY